MSILPTSYQPTKNGYKKYTADGGALDYANFRVWERRSPLQIIEEDINRFHGAMIYAYDRAMYYKSIGDEVQYELNMYTSEVRAKHLAQAHQQLELLTQTK
jgi:hypothetical protein